MNYGTDLKVKAASHMKMGSKSSPRAGHAVGQGAGMGGYNAGAVNKAFAMVKGSGGKPEYYCSGSRVGK